MADPWAILAQGRIDTPGLINAYTAGRDRRMQQMLFERQIAKEDREADRAIQRQKALGDIFTQPKGGDQSVAAPVANGASIGGGIGGGAGVSGPPATLVNPSQLPPRTDGVQINRDALMRLYQIDPETAKGVQDFVYNADKRGFEQMERNGQLMYRAADQLKQIPMNERAAFFQSNIAPILVQNGLDPAQFGGIDFSDRGLDTYANFGMSLADLTKARQPGTIEQNYDFFNRVRPGGGDQYVTNQLDPLVPVLEYDQAGNGYTTYVPRSQLGGGGASSQPQSTLPPGYTKRSKGGATPTASGNFPAGQ